MVKGNSKQVIVVHSPEQKMFEQAIFILRDDAVGRKGVTEAQLMREANSLLQRDPQNVSAYGRVLWAALGAGVTGLVWLISALI